MNASDYWTIFMETGAPEAYLMFKAMQTEGTHVFDDPSNRPKSDRLQ